MGKHSAKAPACQPWIKRADVGQALNSIKWIEGSLMEFPTPLKKELRRHLCKKGEDDFYGMIWSPTVGSLESKGEKTACFQQQNGSVIRELGRFSYQSQTRKRQIVVVRLPRVHKIIVATRQHSIQDYGGSPGHIAFRWKAWVACDRRQTTIQEEFFQVTYPTATQSLYVPLHLSQQSVDEHLSRETSSVEEAKDLTPMEVPPWSRSTTESDDDVTQPKTSGARQETAGQLNRDHGALDSDKLSTNPISIHLRPRKTINYDITMANDDIVRGMEEDDDPNYANRSDVEYTALGDPNTIEIPVILSTPAEYRRYVSQMQRTNDNTMSPTPNPVSSVQADSNSFEETDQSDAVPTTLPIQSFIKIESDEESGEDHFDNVVFTFEDLNGNLKSRSDFSSCDSETALFDEAFTSGIGVTKDTRMLSVSIAGLPETNVRVAKQTIMGFDSMILNPIKSLLRENGPHGKIEIVVKHLY